MLPLGSPMVEQVNTALDELDADGTLATLREKWFGESTPQSGS